MSFWEHLSELRVRIIHSLFIIMAAFAFTYGFPFGYKDIPPLRFKLWAWAHIVILFGALGGLAWLIRHSTL
jgi:hypothetical protein